MNNTIAYNNAGIGGGLGCDLNADPVFINNILYGNSAAAGSQVYLSDTQSDPVFEFCDIQGRKDGFAGVGAGANYAGLCENNIDFDPLFKDTASVDFRLSDASQCIGAGTDSIEIAGVWYKVPPFCIGGNPRPSPAGSKPDIGAFENLRGTPTGTGVDQQPNSLPRSYALEQNFPNPFNPSTTIRFALPHSSWVSMKVYNVLGQEVTTLVDEEKPAGTYDLQFSVQNLSSGMYVYRMHAGDFMAAKQLIVLK